MIDYRALQYFNEVANCGSIRSAADRLHIAGSAISRKLSLLEMELGVRLFTRSKVGMALTIEGEACRKFARTMTFELERLYSELEALRELRSGCVRIASVQGAVADVVIRAITRFRAEHPRVKVELSVGSADDVLEAVEDRSAEVGIGANGKHSKEVRTVFRAAAPVCAIMAPDPRLATSGQLTFKELLGFAPLALPDQSFAIRRQIDEYANSIDAELDPILVTNSIEALRAFARQGLGATILPELAVRDDVQSGRLQTVPLSDAIFKEASHDIVTAKGRQLSPAAREFVQLVMTTLHADATPPLAVAGVDQVGAASPAD